jgi:protein SCO1
MLIRKILSCAVLALVATLTLACASTAQFAGTDLGATPAPDFRLTDQNGHAVALSDLRNRVVVLTFLYTNCQDTCPLIASKLSRVYAQLGAAAQDVSLVAVSVDPQNDTPAAIAAFERKNGVEGELLYLNGTRAQLEPVWRAYYIGVGTPEPSSNQVGHSTRLVLIDRQGRQRVNLDADFVPDDLTRDIQLLLKE